jgi:hypothetical protein
VGNVEKSTSSDIYEVYQGKIQLYGSNALRENLTNYFDKKVPESYKITPEKKAIPKDAQFLSGIGSSAYFRLEVLADSLRITRYTEYGEQDFQGYSNIPEGFSSKKPYKFVYDSNCKFCTVEQEGDTFRLELKKKEDNSLNSAQRVHSA